MIPDNVKRVMFALEEIGYEAYIVGGASLYHYAHATNLKDYQIAPKDYDIFTNCNAETLLETFLCKPIGGQERLDKIFTVVTNDGIEISTYRSDGKRLKEGSTIFEHQATCDFTINAIAMKSDGTFILPPYVNTHLQKKELHAMGNPRDRILEDHNRILRAYRTASKYNLYIEDNLYKVLKLHNINKIPTENIRDELFKILQYENGIDKLYQSHVLFEIFPELKEMKGLVGQSIYHEETVLEHSIQTYREMLKFKPDPIMLFAALMHDIGKPKAFNPETGKFTGHEEAGVPLINEIVTRLKFKNEDVKRISWLVENHMFSKASVSTRRKKWYKFFNSMHDHHVLFSEFILLQYCDTISRKINDHWLKEKTSPFSEWYREQPAHSWYKDYQSGNFPRSVTNLEINGHDILSLGIQPSDKVGKILNRLWEMCLADEIKNDHSTLTTTVSKWIANGNIDKL